MPKEITAYQAEDGSIHPNACAAARRDLEALVQASPLADNQPYAKVALDWLMDRADVILTALEEYHHACPKAAKEEARQESGEGPVVGVQTDGD